MEDYTNRNITMLLIGVFFITLTNIFAQESTMELNGTSTTQDDITVSYSEGYFTNSKKTRIQVWDASKHPYANEIDGGNDYLDISISPATYIVSIKVAYETNVLDLVLQFMKDGSVVKEVSGFAGNPLKENTTYSVGTIADVIRLYDTGEKSSSGGFELSHITFNSSLPVELTSFTAALIKEGIKLNWQTATEVNNYGFEIERASSSISPVQKWTTIGFVEGSGNSNSPKAYEYIDSDLPIGEVEYRLKQIDTDGKYKYYSQTAKVDINITDIKEEVIPTKFALEQNYPNPFNPTTTINYSIPNVGDANFASPTNVTLLVFDMLGRQVATLVNKEQAAGNYSVNFDASSLSSGIYIYRITTGDSSTGSGFIQSRKMLLLK